MVVSVQEALKQIEDENKRAKNSIKVEKDIDPDIDAGNMLLIDTNPLDDTDLKSNQELYLKNLARDNTQLLINELWKLPIECNDEVYLAKLPAPSSCLPREKPIPKPKPLTKWQEFAKLKGIKNKKRTRMLWDEKTQSYKPRWGYKRANDDTKEWVIEIPKNADPFEDQFEKRNTAKKERVAKNELQRLRNIARRSGKKVPGVGETLMPNKEKSISELGTAYHHAKVSTASLGQFEDKMKGEKAERGKKRKFDPLIQKNGSEKSNQLKLLEEIKSKKSRVNVTKAVNREMGRQEATGKGRRGKKGK